MRSYLLFKRAKISEENLSARTFNVSSLYIIYFYALLIVPDFLSIYLSIYARWCNRGGVWGVGGLGPGGGGAPTATNQLWGGPACKRLTTPDILHRCVMVNLTFS